jgi:hypothetical protein
MVSLIAVKIHEPTLRMGSLKSPSNLKKHGMALHFNLNSAVAGLKMAHLL